MHEAKAIKKIIRNEIGTFHKGAETLSAWNDLQVVALLYNITVNHEFPYHTPGDLAGAVEFLSED